VLRQRVLDYGCGSGILAIAAGCSDRADIDAVDIDPAAVDATQANAQANGVHLNAGLPDACAGRLLAGAGQHPGHAA
jgi:ribosomal protein L11 methyltransferase